MTNSAAEVIMLFVYTVNLLCRIFSLEVAATVMDALFQFLSYLSDVKRNIFYLTKKNTSAQRGARTRDPEIKSLMLYRLS